MPAPRRLPREREPRDQRAVLTVRPAVLRLRAYAVQVRFLLLVWSVHVKHIRNWNDLSKYGIIPLTGEADRTGQRMLCDSMTAGRSIICDMLGLHGSEQDFGDSSLELQPFGGAKYSMMLPLTLFADLAAWCLLDAQQVRRSVLRRPTERWQHARR